MRMVFMQTFFTGTLQVTMGAFVGLAGKALKAVLKIALFCGLAWFLIPYLFMYYTPETSLNHVFEDLRKSKAPNKADAFYSF